MPTAIDGLTPEPVWKYFAAIARIPRPSKHEEKIAAYVLDTAKRLGLKARQDRAGNISVKKQASPGRESVPSLALQGHLDMVCEKNTGKTHDFMKDPIELVRSGNDLRANGTTLGADNGIAVATNLAIMEDRSLVHGPLEFLFTIDEETGLTGASTLGRDMIESRTMLNLDSEDEGVIFVGCSGGRDTLATWKAAPERPPAGSAAARLAVRGLRGGHSGLEIDKGRGNAIKILNRVAMALSEFGARLSSMEGGNKRNAIPRECEAVIFLPKKLLPAAVSAVAREQDLIRAEFERVDKDLSITLTEIPAPRGAGVWGKALQQRVCRTIAGLPHGVVKMSADIPGLVETSTNVAVVSSTRKGVELATSQRSSAASELDEMVQCVSSIMQLGGAALKSTDGYPGWKPNLDSPVLRLVKSTYKTLYGKEPAVTAIHAGLECGIIGEKFPGIDMVSFGPTLRGVHSPDEKIEIDSVGKFWNFLLAILRNFKAA